MSYSNLDKITLRLAYNVVAGQHQYLHGHCSFVYRRDTPLSVELVFPDRRQMICRRFLAIGMTEGYDDPEFSIRPVKAGVAITFNFEPYQVVEFAHDELYDALDASWRVVEQDREDEVFDLDAALTSLLRESA